MEKLKRKKQKKQNKRLAKKSILRIVTFLLVIGLNWAGLLAIGRTVAYYSDIESSLGNTYQASSLDFSLINTNIEEFIGVELGEDLEFISIATKMIGSLDIQYEVYAENVGGENDFCDSLNLKAFHSVILYDGLLLPFDTAVTTNLGAWAFELRLPYMASHFPHGEECNVDLVFQGWRDDVVDFNDSGFTDEERIHLRLTSRMIVLNEFLPNPEGVAYGFDFGDDSSTMPRGEWVELYNNSDVEYNVNGWYIWDASADDLNKVFITDLNTQPASTTIPGKSWLVVYMNREILDNIGGTVKLFNGEDVLVDSYTYTGHDYCELEPTPEEENSYTTGGGSCGEVPPNKSYARLPDGIGSWVDPIPTPGGANILDNKDDITFFELIEEFMNSNEETEDLTGGLEELEEPADIEIMIGPEISMASEFPEDSIIETVTPSTEEVIIIEEDPQPEPEQETEEIEEEIIQEEPVVEEELPIEEELPVQEEEILEDESVVEEEEPVIEEPIEESAPEEVLIEDPQPEPLKEPDPEPDPEPEPEPDPEPESDPDPESEPDVENNNEEENV